MNFLANNNVTALERCPNYPDVAAADYYLFFRLKSKLKGLGCCDATDIFNPLNAELNSIFHLQALLGGATIVVVSRLRVKNGTEDLKIL
jgi:hypothetical protein